jgi:F-type H+-transporting ATPase subunit c
MEARQRTKNFPAETMLRVGGRNEKIEPNKKEISMLDTLPMLAAEAGNFGPFLPLAFAGLGAGVGVGIVGGKAAEAVGRNPSAFGSILVMAIIGMALAEAIAIYGLIIAFTK